MLSAPPRRHRRHALRRRTRGLPRPDDPLGHPRGLRARRRRPRPVVAEDAAALAILDRDTALARLRRAPVPCPTTWVGADTTVDRLEEKVLRRARADGGTSCRSGLANPDHAAAHEAGLRVHSTWGAAAWLCYEDIGLQAHPRHAGLAGAPAVPDRGVADARSQCPSTTDDRPQAGRPRLLPLAAASRSRPTGRSARSSSRPSRCGDCAPPPPGWEGLIDAWPAWRDRTA